MPHGNRCPATCEHFAAGVLYSRIENGAAVDDIDIDRLTDLAALWAQQAQSARAAAAMMQTRDASDPLHITADLLTEHARALQLVIKGEYECGCGALTRNSRMCESCAQHAGVV